MKRTLAATLAIALVGLFVAGPALAGSCPRHMGDIDAKLQSASLDDAQMSQVKELRAQGEELHKSGKHGESVAALKKAKEILGIE